jgi:hypothetical protein
MSKQPYYYELLHNNNEYVVYAFSELEAKNALSVKLKSDEPITVKNRLYFTNKKVSINLVIKNVIPNKTKEITNKAGQIKVIKEYDYKDRVEEIRDAVKCFIRQDYEALLMIPDVMKFIKFNGTSNEFDFNIELFSEKKRISYNFKHVIDSEIPINIVETDQQKMVRNKIKDDRLVHNTGFIVFYDKDLYKYSDDHNIYEKLRQKIIVYYLNKTKFNNHLTLLEALDAAYECRNSK